MTKEEALKLALEYLEASDNYLGSLDHSEPIAAIKEALAQPAQEPFGWYSAQEDEFMTDKIRKDHERLNSYTHIHGKFDLALYTTPPTAQPAQEPDRQALQANGTHPAPCARHCEAQAFKVEIRNLKAQLEQPAQEPRIDQGPDYERGFVDGRMYQTQTSVDKAVNAIAKPAQEPVAWGYRSKDGEIYDCISPEAHADAEGDYTVPLYAAPFKRPWVGLTDEERKEIMRYEKDFWGVSGWEWKCMEALEATLKDKNT